MVLPPVRRGCQQQRHPSRHNTEMCVGAGGSHIPLHAPKQVQNSIWGEEGSAVPCFTKPAPSITRSHQIQAEERGTLTAASGNRVGRSSEVQHAQSSRGHELVAARVWACCPWLPLPREWETRKLRQQTSINHLHLPENGGRGVIYLSALQLQALIIHTGAASHCLAMRSWSTIGHACREHSQSLSLQPLLAFSCCMSAK